MKRVFLSAAIVASWFFVCTGARALASDPPPNAKTTDVKLDLSGGYQGVAPGSPNLPPQQPPAKGDSTQGPARVTWPGFQVRAGVPTVFVQLTRTVTWQVVEGKDQLIVLLKDTAVPLKNNRRPLKVTEFGTAVREIVLKPRDRDVALVIRLSHKVAHREHIEDSADNLKLLVIELV